ncbi:YhgE/Pip family protein [Nesterenkonia lacusekhoensis]|uniref:Membrane protein n=1 Tax=Nesterenkonia lacusekhoensis TaxID=150832 RepID=A0ABS4T3A4_9MICC|nr:YhgE/Pip domain-containing protein [Nesterenkonia lacusekhoensis]MBP2317771.1 putative membrane protein [Nesterenkonia lacusekhoensis]
MSLKTLPRAEWKRLTSGFDPIKTVVGLALIPLLYAAVYLYANWDPYGNMDNVDAALVTLDEGAEFDGEHRVIGDDVVDDLLEDESFGWQVVSERELAEQGTSRGDYQFALVIPEDFSASLASPAELEDPEQAQIEIISNEANNYLLSSILDVLAAELHESVSEEVGREAADQMLTGFGQIHQQLEEAADGAGDLQDGAHDLESGLVELHDGSGELSQGASELNDGVGELNDALATLRSGTQDLDEGAGQLSAGSWELFEGIAELDDGAGDLQEGVGALAGGAWELHEGLGELSSGAESVAEGNEQLAGASQAALDVLSEYEEAAAQRTGESVQQLVEAGIISEEQAEEAAAELTPILEESELVGRAQEVRGDLEGAQDSVDQLAEGSRGVADGASELQSGASELHGGASEMAESLPALTDGLGEARSASYSLAEGAGELSEGTQEADAGVGQLQVGAGELSEGTGELEEGAAELDDGLGEALEGTEQLSEGSGELASELGSGAEEVPSPDEQEREQTSSVIGNPLNITQSAQAEAGSYGAGMAPFFMGLALWIGALVMLQVLRPFSPRAVASNASTAAVAFGSWLPFLALSAVQSLLLYSAVTLGLGLEPAHPGLALLVLLAASAAFSALVHGLVALLGNPGKFVAIILLVLQLVAAGGTFPSQSLPGPLESIHPMLPLTYVVDGLRHAIYGADTSVVLSSLGALGAATAVGLAVLLVAIRKNRMWTLKRLHPPIEEDA